MAVAQHNGVSSEVTSDNITCNITQQVTHLAPCDFLQLLDAADDADLLAILAGPNGDGRAPEPAAVSHRDVVSICGLGLMQ